MTPQQIDAMKQALEALEMYGKRHRATYLLGGAWDEEITLGGKAITAIKEALAEHAMRETQRLGQEIEQEPVVYQCPRCATSMQVDLTAKAALAQMEQEPVAWLSTDSIGERHLCFDKPLDNDPVQPLYTSPPQRTWVGLTDKDWNRSKHNYDFQKGVDWAELILKEKNT